MAMMGGAAMGDPDAEEPQPDTAETVQISSFCLLKMLRHGEEPPADPRQRPLGDPWRRES